MRPRRVHSIGVRPTWYCSVTTIMSPSNFSFYLMSIVSDLMDASLCKSKKERTFNCNIKKSRMMRGKTLLSWQLIFSSSSIFTLENLYKVWDKLTIKDLFIYYHFAGLLFFYVKSNPKDHIFVDHFLTSRLLLLT